MNPPTLSRAVRPLREPCRPATRSPIGSLSTAPAGVRVSEWLPCYGGSGARDPAPLHVAQPLRREALHTRMTAAPSLNKSQTVADMHHDVVGDETVDERRHVRRSGEHVVRVGGTQGVGPQVEPVLDAGVRCLGGDGVVLGLGPVLGIPAGVPTCCGRARGPLVRSGVLSAGRVARYDWQLFAPHRPAGLERCEFR